MATTTITKTASANITLTAGQWLVVSGDGTYTLGPGLYNGKIVGIVNRAKIGPFPFDQTVVLCASVTDLVYYTQSAPIGTYPMSLDPASGLITDPAQRAAVGEAASLTSYDVMNANGWYAAGQSQMHLTNAGYDGLGALIASQIP